MHNLSFAVRIATQGLVGFGQAPGTVATLLVIPLVYFLGGLSLSFFSYLCISILLLCAGTVIVHKALPSFNEADPSAIVLDEMVCFLFVFMGIPISAMSLIIGFGLFRFFDIVKPFGITYCERLPGAWGVIADDFVAALMSNAVLHILMYGWYVYCCVH